MACVIRIYNLRLLIKANQDFHGCITELYFDNVGGPSVDCKVGIADQYQSTIYWEGHGEMGRNFNRGHLQHYETEDC